MDFNLFEKVLDSIPYSIWIIDTNNKFLFVNIYYAKSLNLNRKDIIGKTLKELFSKEISEEYIRSYKLVEREGKPRLFSGYFEHLGYPAETFIECYISPITETGKITCFLGILQDQSKRKRYEKDLISQKDLLNTIIETIPDAIYQKDLDGRYIICNEALAKDIYINEKEKILGKNVQELAVSLGNNKNILIENNLADTIVKAEREVRKTKKKRKCELAINCEKNMKYIESIKVPVINNHGDITGIVGIVRDITDTVILENKLKKMSYRDKLTELYNRAYFDEKLEELSRIDFLPLSFIMGDVNGLKIINDTIGHLEGDKLLINIANVIKASCRIDDFIFRWGGDEFCILLPNTDEKETEIICNRIRKKCKEFSEGDFLLSIALGSATRKDINRSIDSMIIEAEDRVYREKLIYEKEIKKRIVESLQKNLAKKDLETKEHIKRVEEYAFILGKKLKLEVSELSELCSLARFHDIGKVGIPIDILTKPGKLTKDEFEIIKTHSEKGYRIAMFNPDIEYLAQGILTHHERFDGNGYPLGLKGKEIPFLSRIICVVDSYDAMTGDRTYKKKMSKEEAKLELKRCSGNQFDPEIVKVFLDVIDEL